MVRALLERSVQGFAKCDAMMGMGRPDKPQGFAAAEATPAAEQQRKKKTK